MSTNLKLPIHEIEDSVRVIDFIGHELNGVSKIVAVSRKQGGACAWEPRLS